jgi:probable O-glycosylation ligase (exosortase A-associated)
MTGNVIVAQGIERIKSLTSAGGDPNSLAASMDIALPFVLVLVRRARTLWLKGVLVMFAFFMAYAVILSGSRGGLLGLLGGLFFLWLTSKQKVLYGAVAAVAIFAAVSFMPKQYIERYSTIASYAEGEEVDESSRLRLEGWKAGWEMFLDHPILGVGANTFGWAHAEYYSPEFQRNSLKAHSMYFQIIAELGFVGVVSFVGLLFLVIRYNIRIQRRLRGTGEEGEWYIGVSRATVISIFVLCITAIFGHSLYRFHWLFVGAVTVAMHRIVISGSIDSRKTLNQSHEDQPELRSSEQAPIPQERGS